ncbi:MAG: dihydrodipicolinate synthase family protein [Pseudomonadota bacterium]|nr:dihydrodipicolinate synthase family protein [Pseudomonadota bacterium]
MQIRLPQIDGAFRVARLKATPLRPLHAPAAFNRDVYAAAHVVIDPLRSVDPWSAPPVVDWDATLAFRSHLYALGFKVAEAMDTAQRGMGVDWPIARELIVRSVRHARACGGDLACGVGTDQLATDAGATLAQVEAAYREQLEVVEAEGGRAILMASRALCRAARGPDDYLALYGRLLESASRPVILHWLGEMFDPALLGYWGSADRATALATVATLIRSHVDKVAGIKVSLLDTRWELALRAQLPAGVRMYTGDDFNYAELMAGDEHGHSHGLLGIFDPIAPVAALALQELAAGSVGRFREVLDPTVALSREIFRAPTPFYKAGVVFLAWLNGHQDHFAMAGGMQSARGVVHYARVFELADACGVLADPELALHRMQAYLKVSCGEPA